MHRRTSGATTELVVECLVRLQPRGRTAQNTILKRTQALTKRYRPLKALQLVLQRYPHGVGLARARPCRELLGELVDGLAANIEGHISSCVDVNTLSST